MYCIIKPNNKNVFIFKDLFNSINFGVNIIKCLGLCYLLDSNYLRSNEKSDISLLNRYFATLSLSLIPEFIPYSAKFYSLDCVGRKFLIEDLNCNQLFSAFIENRLKRCYVWNNYTDYDVISPPAEYEMRTFTNDEHELNLC